MTDLNFLRKQFSKTEENFNEIVKNIINSKNNVICGLNYSAKSIYLSFLYEEINKTLLLVVPDINKAEEIFEDLKNLLSEEKVYLFPTKEILTTSSIAHQLNILHNIKKNIFIVATIEALLYKVPSPNILSNYNISFYPKLRINYNDLLKKLYLFGFERRELVETRGEMSIKGDILDIYPSNALYPYRIEFLYDEIISIKEFEIENQRSIKKIENLTIFSEKENFDKLVNFFSYFQNEDLIILDEPKQLQKISLDFIKELSLISDKLEPNFLQRKISSFQEILEQLKGKTILNLSLLKVEEKSIFIPILPLENYKHKLKLFLDDLSLWLKNNYTIILACENQGQIDRLKEILREYNIFLSSYIIFIILNLTTGFCYEKIVFITYKEIFGSIRKEKHFISSSPIFSFVELKPNDYVVHTKYGIGKFEGMQKIKIEGITQDFLTIQYLDNDKLYVPIYDFNLIQKYVGQENVSPKLHKLGSFAWTNTKNKVKDEIMKLAQEIVEVSAARKIQERPPFLKDTLWEKEFEQDFMYEETKDQFKAIIDVKNDLESSTPMDRLICGDVGYGKTEVAMRAAFKVVMNNKQVAALVPTTILAEQHYLTFKERFVSFPVKIEVLSRFKSKKEQLQILENLKKGYVDIIIGTHRLLQNDVHFKDLGLIIIDDEQKFGVVHKEKLKKIKKLVDVLTLSATPIPRTLYLSLSGVKSISVVETPPEHRLPIYTYVTEFNKNIIREAILKEKSRNGQIFFVHNRIENIEKMKKYLKKLVPEVSMIIAHSKLSSQKLEKIMMDFIKKKYDVLISTTIIEAGLDLPNVNTIIINNADMFGLSQLYQLRGRVGRSYHHAYAYLFYSKQKVLTEIAQKRLKTIEEFFNLGAGFKIAMRDLELRGSGNILGIEQHGFIQAIGFDLYCQLLEESLAKIKGETIIKLERPKIDIPINAYLPDFYITDVSQRIKFYKELMLANEVSKIKEIESELIDRFGKLPSEVVNLLEITNLSISAALLDIVYLGVKNSKIKIDFKKTAKIDPQKIITFCKKYNKIQFKEKKTFSIIIIGEQDVYNNIRLIKEVIDMLNT